MKKRLDESQAKLRKAIEQNKELKCLVKTEIASLRKKVAVAETTVADLRAARGKCEDCPRLIIEVEKLRKDKNNLVQLA